MTKASKADEVDVLIVGAGPAGLMLATWLSRLKIRTRIIDKRSTKIFTGQADGVQCRTVEVFHSFGFAERFIREASHINEVCFWNPGEEGGIVRTKRTADNDPGTSRFPHGVLTQGRIERFFLDAIKEFGNLEVERPIQPTSLSIDTSKVDDPSAHPVTVTLRYLTEEEGTPTQVGTVPNGLFRANLFPDDEADAQPRGNGSVGTEETVTAKYVVGCDGARSWVRKQIGLTLEGDSANMYWGVIDAAVITDFPDIRYKCAVHSESAGSILIVPRERNLVRFYVQLGNLQVGERVDRTKVTPEQIISTAQRILAPYKLECPEIDWWTCYEIGQRLCPRVTNEERVFIAGDAFHTHSPKAGQGMNVSMMDTFNLGWKLAHVIQGRAHRSILKTYQTERHQVAKELIDFDYKFSRLFSGKPSKDAADEAGISLEEFKDVFVKAGRWASGTAVHYRPSLLVSAAEQAQKLAPGLPLGMRFESHQVVCISDARRWHIGDRFESDGRWRIVLFAGDLRVPEQQKELHRVAAYFDSPPGPLRKFTPTGEDIDSVIEVLTIVSNPRTSIELNDYPDILWPKKGKWGYRDYWKIYADDDTYGHGHGQIYSALGIDPLKGCAVAVRPDQYVAHIAALEEVELIGAFFDRFMLQPGGNA